MRRQEFSRGSFVGVGVTVSVTQGNVGQPPVSAVAEGVGVIVPVDVAVGVAVLVPVGVGVSVPVGVDVSVPVAVGVDV